MVNRFCVSRCCCGGSPSVPLTYLANNHAWNVVEHDYSTMPAIPLPLTAGTSQISPVGASVPEDYTCSVRLVTGSSPPATINPTSTGDSEGGRLEAYATVSSFTRTADQYYSVDINQDLVTYPNRNGLMSAPKASFGSTLRYFFTLSGAKDPTYAVYPEFNIGIGGMYFNRIGFSWAITAPFASVTQHISPWPSESTSDFEVEISGSTVNVYITDSVYTRELMASTNTAYSRKGAYNSQILQHRTNFVDLSGLDYHIDGGVVTNKTLGSWTLSDGDWSESAGTISMDNSGKSASVGGTYEPDERYFAHQTVTLAADTLHRISWDTSGTDYDAIPAVAIDDVCISQLPDATYGKSAIDRLSESYFFKTDGSGSTKVAFYQWSQKDADISNIKIEELT